MRKTLRLSACFPSILLAVIFGLITANFSHALTVLTGPTFTKSTTAPLAGTLALTTDTASRVSVSVSDGTNSWERSFYDYRKSHAITLLGFKPGRTNAITVTVRDKFEHEVTVPTPVNFVSDPLPSDFPKIVLLTNQPDKMEPGYTLFRCVNNNNGKPYLTIVDNAGEVVWYSGIVTILDVRQLPNGNLFVPLVTSFIEVNMLGQTVRTWNSPVGWPINNHDGVPTDHGTILYFSDASRIVTNFPSSAFNSNAPPITTNVWHQPVVEISATNASLLNTWSIIDMLDPLRINYLTFTIRTARGWDWEHANAVIEDPRDGAIIISMRHQDAVVKFSRAGELKWILGPHENWGTNFQQYLLTPVGEPFRWNYAQHTPKVTPQGTILLHDNGNLRASPFDTSIADSNNFSRAVEYNINEDTMEVSQVWEYGENIAERVFAGSVGDTDWLPGKGNVLITHGNIGWVNGARPSPYSAGAAMVRIKEVTHDPEPEVVFDLMLFDSSNTNAGYRGYLVYRSERIADLYADAPQAVEDLAITRENDVAHLKFSGYPARTYAIEASTNLLDWEELTTLTDYPGGEFDYTDTASDLIPTRYYRVITR